MNPFHNVNRPFIQKFQSLYYYIIHTLQHQLKNRSKKGGFGINRSFGLAPFFVDKWENGDRLCYFFFDLKELKLDFYIS